MHKIQLGFKAFDAHELLCHFIAVHAGLYKENKLSVELHDITFIADNELPKHWFQASCGAAVTSVLRGTRQRVLFVATDRPMFWIYSTADIKELKELENKTIATFPPVAPPHHLANIILNKAGASKLTLHSARDDAARLGLLTSQNVSAAVLSSAISPVKIQDSGFNKLAFFGDELRIPTTGLAVEESYIEQEPNLVQDLVSSHRKSLELLHDDSDFIAKVLQKYFDVTKKHAGETASLYQSYYTQTGTTTPEIAQNAIDSLCKAMNISEAVSWKDIYLF